MTVKAAPWVLLGFLAFAPRLATAGDARLPYHHIYRIQQVQAELNRTHTNLILVLQMRSTLTNVASSNLVASLDSQSGRIPIVFGADGSFSVPLRDDLLAEDPWITVNQPAGTMELNWHGGLTPTLARQMTNTFHYASLMRALRDYDDIQGIMRNFFPAAPRLTAVGVRVTFHSSAIAPSAIIHASDGDRRLPADSLGELIIPLADDLLHEDPVMLLTEKPIAVEIVARKTDTAP